MMKERTRIIAVLCSGPLTQFRSRSARPMDDDGLLDIMVTKRYVHSIIKLFVWSDDAGVVISHFTFAEASLPLWKTTAEGRTSDARIVTVGAPTFL